jgi:5'-nucleotidase
MGSPLILLCNDDGYRAAGVRVLRDALATFAEVVICAPETEQSAASHSLSIHRPLRLVQREDAVFSVDGTPADCVYVALHAGTRVLPRAPDLVVSGLNDGVNLGADVFYSGTVAAAREGALRGHPALAASAGKGADMVAASKVSARLARAMLEVPSPRPLLLNANFPAGANWPVRATRSGERIYQEGVEFRSDPRGKEYLWIGGPGAEHKPGRESDTDAYDEGVVGVTPLVLDLWNARQREGTERIVAQIGQAED